MIKTVEEVSFDTVDFDRKAIVFAAVKTTTRHDAEECYYLEIEEWIELPNGAKKIVRCTNRAMNFVQADQLTDTIDANFQLTETGAKRRKRYTEIGHLLINNMENVRNVKWEFC